MLPLFGFTMGDKKNEEIALTYWDAVKNNDVVMTDEELIENYSSIIPAWVNLRFNAEMEIDGQYYDYFFIDSGEFDESGISLSAGKPNLSEKKIKNGLYNNLYPMVKTETGRDDIKYLWHPAANCLNCVFFKFSIDNYTSDWISIIGVPESKNVKKSVFSVPFSQKIKASLENPSGESFKIEGIRVIYNCDYELVIDYLHEAYYFVNNNKEYEPHFIEAGAKYMELKESVFNSARYWWTFENYDKRNEMFVSSIEKINFEDEMSAQAQIKKKQEDNYLLLRNKLNNPDIMPYTNRCNYTRDFYEALLQEAEESDTGMYKNQLVEKAQNMLRRFDEINQDKNFSLLKEKLEDPTIQPENCNNTRDFYEALLQEAEESDTGMYKNQLVEKAQNMLRRFDEINQQKKTSKKRKFF